MYVYAELSRLVTTPPAYGPLVQPGKHRNCADRADATAVLGPVGRHCGTRERSAVTIDRHPRAGREIVVAHASDVHVDHNYTARLFGGDGAGGLRAVLVAARAAGADVVLLAGDTFDSIERFSGSGASDVFVVNDDANYIDGAGGVDLLTFASEGAGITLNLNATGADTYLNIESFEGSAFNDTLIGTSRDENFVGGAGADSINGGAGKDFAWYVNSSAGVSP